MAGADAKSLIRAEAARLGFDAIGFTEARLPDEARARLDGFLAEGMQGTMGWLAEEMTPLWLRIGGYWYPRGGIPIDVFWQTGAPPEGLWVPEQGVAAYRGRG